MLSEESHWEDVSLFTGGIESHPPEYLEAIEVSSSKGDLKILL